MGSDFFFKQGEVVVVVVDSHIQRIVLATEETTVTQEVSHRPIKRQSRLWSQRGTKVEAHFAKSPIQLLDLRHTNPACTRKCLGGQ